jgi:hypothetical protein
VRYAFDLASRHDPVTAPLLEETSGGRRFLSVRFRRLQVASDIRYLVHASADLLRWEALAIVEPGSPQWVEVRDTKPVGEAGRRFLRVAVISAGTYEFWQTAHFDPEELNSGDGWRSPRAPAPTVARGPAGCNGR